MGDESECRAELFRDPSAEGRLAGEWEHCLDAPDAVDRCDTLEPCNELSQANPSSSFSSSSSSFCRLLQLTIPSMLPRRAWTLWPWEAAAAMINVC
jgi:hypothetical protein